MYKYLWLILIVILVSCSTHKKIQKSFTGEPIAKIQEELGKPKTIFDQNDGSKMYVFEKMTELRSTEISQAKLTLDPMVTPMVKKTERYYVTVRDEIITKIKFEEEYER
jgi:hypothetical protein